MPSGDLRLIVVKCGDLRQKVDTKWIQLGRGFGLDVLEARVFGDDAECKTGHDAGMKWRGGIAWAVALMLCIGALSLPYGYYTLLRVVACSFAVWMLLEDWNGLATLQRWFLIAAALLYNPLWPVHFSKPAWMMLDLACGAAFAWLAFRWSRSGGRM